MPVRSDDPLRRVTLNLYEADCKLMEEAYGHGWTTVIRDLVAKHVKYAGHVETQLIRKSRLTLGDLTDE